MKLRKLFQRFLIGFRRLVAPSLPRLSDAKRYGNLGENDVMTLLQQRLPECKIKRNVLVCTADGKAELDGLILYCGKLFALEVKNWKGHLSEGDDGIVQRKIDQWTGDSHVRYHKSPFKQVKRAVYLLRQQIPIQAWVSPIVYFEGADSICVASDVPWFSRIDCLADYIISQGKAEKTSPAFFQKCAAADVLYRGINSYACRVCDESLRFRTPHGVVERAQIHRIFVLHHWGYDDVVIQTTSGGKIVFQAENASVVILNHGNFEEYALCKIDRIELGI